MSVRAWNRGSIIITLSRMDGWMDGHAYVSIWSLSMGNGLGGICEIINYGKWKFNAEPLPPLFLLFFRSIILSRGILSLLRAYFVELPGISTSMYKGCSYFFYLCGLECYFI